ncbi:hypothetical protein D3C72_2461220 [compost metagenome]
MGFRARFGAAMPVGSGLSAARGRQEEEQPPTGQQQHDGGRPDDDEELGNALLGRRFRSRFCFRSHE